MTDDVYAFEIPPLIGLRREIATAEFDGFLVPMGDEFQSEYVPPSAQRIAFLSGFTGSAAFIIVLKDKAAFFTDSRYTLQAARQVAATDFEIFDSGKQAPLDWLAENISPGAVIAYDPWLHTADGVERLQKKLATVGATAAPVARNLVDIVWEYRPTPPVEPIYPYLLAFAGKSSADKRAEIAAGLKKKNQAAAVITDPASVAWLLNIRGGDVVNTPLPLSRAIIDDVGGVQWFVDERKLTAELATHVGEQVKIHTMAEFPAALDGLAHGGRPVMLNPAHASGWIVDYLRSAGGKIDYGDDPCELPKACKNSTELDGMRAAHRRDGAALAKFLAWLDQQWGTERLTELNTEHKLASFRAAGTNYRGPSFDTISAAGEHGAIVHYRATHATDAPLKAGTLYLLDSGGQYLDGTTDVTRTVAIGTPTAEMRDRFTRVLKGHIALATIKFPEGTTGAELDVLARQYLWDIGMDYGHGTGHGVGCYLGVHEGPQAISRRNKVALMPGMILSNEPGFYQEGRYGIRIENLQAVVEILGLTNGETRTFGFEPLTLVPLDRKLIETSMLTDAEREWVNAYHKRVMRVLQPMVDESTAIWLEAVTLPISK